MRKELVRYYTPNNINNYEQSRYKLYHNVFKYQDSLECFYTGYKIPVDKQVNILSWTAKYGIQTEHLYPRSKGSEKLPATADLHHLVPVKATVNTLRKNAPYKETVVVKQSTGLYVIKYFWSRTRIKYMNIQSMLQVVRQGSLKKEMWPDLFFIFIHYIINKRINRITDFFYPCLLICADGTGQHSR